MPILVSTITTVIVFFPVVFLTGVAKNLFVRSRSPSRSRS